MRKPYCGAIMEEVQEQQSGDLGLLHGRGFFLKPSSVSLSLSRHGLIG